MSLKKIMLALLLMTIVIVAALMYALVLLELTTSQDEIEVTGNPEACIKMDWKDYVHKHGKIKREKDLKARIE